MSNFPFAVDRDLTSVSLAFQNRRFVADMALPRFPVQAMNYSYNVYDFQEGFLLHDDMVGRRGQPNEVEFHAEEVESKTKDRALDDLVPILDGQSARGSEAQHYARVAERLTNLLALNREKRVADLLFDAETYPADNKIVLAGQSSLTDSANSDPIGVIDEALEAPIMRPNTMVIGRNLWNVVKRHPKIMKAVNGTLGDEGIATREQVREMFELDQLLIGEGFYIQGNLNANAEKTPVRLWGSALAVYYLDQVGGPMENPSFGFTAQWGKRISGKGKDMNIGMRGGHRIRVGESVDEQICAPRLGYLIEDAMNGGE